MSNDDKVLRLQLRKLALQLRELTHHVGVLASTARAVQDEQLRIVGYQQVETALVELTASIDGLLNEFPPEIRAEGNGN